MISAEKDELAPDDYLLGGGDAAASSDTSLSPLGLAALAYAEKGQPVFPCGPGSKQPLGRLVPNGFKDATTDPEIIRGWWTEAPAANIGMPTGLPTTFSVLDVDIKPDQDILGDATLEGLVALNGELPVTRLQLTPSGGMHFCFAYTPGIGNSAGTLGKGLDIRGEGGYIVVAPSVLPNGAYTWSNDVELAGMPGWITAKLTAKKGKYKVPPDAGPGNRNDTLWNLGRSLKASGVDDVSIGAALLARNQAFTPPLAAAEVDQLIDRVIGTADRPAFTPPRPRDSTSPSQQTGKTYRSSDTGNAERFRDQHQHHARYCPEWKSWAIFDGRVWREDVGDLIADQMMKSSLLSIYDEAKLLEDEEKAKKLRGWAFQCENKGRRSAALELAKSEMPVYAREFDTNKWILNCPNGTLDLRTGQLRPARAEDFCTKLAGCDYDPEAIDATWETYITGKLPDITTREWTQRLIGYALVGERTEDIMVDLYGPTRGGKTTLGEVAKNMMGEYAAVLQADSFMVSRQDNAPGGNRPDLALLPGVRLVVSEEAEEHMKLDEGLVKQMTGGASITAAAKYKRPVTFRPEYLWMLIGNHLVKVRDGEEAIWTRIPTIPFNVCVKKQEEKKEIKQYLTTNPRAVKAALAWAVQGCLAWQKIGLKPWAPEVLATTAMYREKMNALAGFVEADCELGVDLKVTAQLLRSRYTKWCQDNRVRPLTDKEMADRLREFKCENAKSTGGLRIWKGIALKEGS